MAVKFTSESAKRIAAAVRRVEQMPPSMSGQPNPAGAAEPTFYAWITGAGSLSGKHHNWVRVFPNFDTDSPDIILDSELKFSMFGTPPITGWASAMELNGARGLSDVVVELRFAGYRKEDGQPMYVFAHEQMQQDPFVPIHDHRDNITGGGFAFSVYHPGTSIPQQPWGI